MADIKYLISVDASGAVTSIKNFEGTLDKTGKAAATASPHVKTFGDVIDNSGKVGSAATAKLAGLWKQIVSGELVVQAINKVYTVFKDLVGDSIKGAIESEKAEKNLKAALEITGRTVEGNLKHYLDFAKAKMRITLYTDEEIQGAQALLVQLTSLNQNGIDRATKGAMGLASTLGIDLHSATMKIVLGMKGQETGLARVGIRLADNLTAEQKQASLLDQLEKLYQRSTKEVDTFGGSLKQSKISLDEMKDTIGKAAIDSDTLKGSLVALKGAIDDLNTIASKEGKNWIDMLAGKAASMPILANIISTIDLMRAKLRLEAAEATYNENVYGGLKIALDTYDKVLMNLGIDVEKITGGFIKHVKVIDETGTGGRELTKTYVEMKKEIEDLAKDTEVSHPAIAKLEKAFDAARKTGKLLTSDLRPIAERLIELKIEAGEKVPTALLIFAGKLDNTVVPASNRAKLASSYLKFSLYQLGLTGLSAGEGLGNTLVPAVRNLGTYIVNTDSHLKEIIRNVMLFSMTMAGMKVAPPDLSKMGILFGHTYDNLKTKAQETWEKIGQCANAAISGMDAIFQQSTNNRMLALDKEYQKRLELIQNSLMSEEEKNQAIEALDAEYNIKRRGVQRKAAEQGKAISIAEAIMNTASAVTGALTMKPWTPFNWILSAITGALGLAQIAIIKAQPIPLALGAIFKRPVFSADRNYVAGDTGPEAVIPLSEMPRLIRELGGSKERDYQSERPIVIQNHIFLDSREMKSFTVKTVRESGRIGLLGRVGKEMA